VAEFLQPSTEVFSPSFNSACPSHWTAMKGRCNAIVNFQLLVSFDSFIVREFAISCSTSAVHLLSLTAHRYYKLHVIAGRQASSSCIESNPRSRESLFGEGWPSSGCKQGGVLEKMRAADKLPRLVHRYLSQASGVWNVQGHTWFLLSIVCFIAIEQNVSP
jgi:hypothetical protein